MKRIRQDRSSIFSRLRLALPKNQWAKGLCVFLMVLGVIWQASHHVSLVYSRTNSLPCSLFLNLKQVTPKRGHYTCFDCPWYGGRVIKKIVGMEGDILFYDDKGDLWIESILQGNTIRDNYYSAYVGFLKVGKQKGRSKDGRLLTPIKAGVIPKGKVFVVGDHERSFDSRYEELGLVPEEALQGRLLAIL